MGNDIPTRRPRVLIAEDEALLLYTLNLILEAHADVVGEAMDGPAAVEMAERLHPDVVLLDISMPIFSGVEAARRIQQSRPEIRIIIVSSHTSPVYVEEVLNRGAHGYVFKGLARTQLPKALNDVMNGRIFRPGVAGWPS